MFWLIFCGEGTTCLRRTGSPRAHSEKKYIFLDQGLTDQFVRCTLMVIKGQKGFFRGALEYLEAHGMP
ncbi:MAG: hypothetical protein B0D92_04610 [Spirochaeta sp. LUC14_002_19_P3]|nr:MAG: hypothetical protein B0D92_04610 [Spirochaeta sp. LUC14_002_19_P3]